MRPNLALSAANDGGRETFHLPIVGIPIIGIPIKTSPDIRRLTHAIVSAGNALLREAGRLFKPHGLTAAQFNVLSLLADAPQGLRAAEITAALVVDASSTTYVLDRMEALGWLERGEHASDRRAWCIRLTPAGRRLHARVAPLYAAALHEVLRDFDARGIGLLVRGLGDIQHAAAAAVDRVVLADAAAEIMKILITGASGFVGGALLARGGEGRPRSDRAGSASAGAAGLCGP